MNGRMKVLRELFEKYLLERNKLTCGVYKRKTSETKRKVKDAGERRGSWIMQNFGGNRTMFWKEVKRVRKENSNSGWSIGVKNENGDIVVNEEEVRKRWAGFF